MENVASIVRLRIKNLLGISEVEIRPGQINQIVGSNNMGKTTILKALGIAAEGSTDGSIVKNGMDSAEILVDLSDETLIRRKITNKGHQTTSVSKGEFIVKSPQGYLDALFDKNAFNPLDLLDPKKRTEAIMNVMPVELSPETLATDLGFSVDKLPPVDFNQHGLKVIDAIHKYYYQRRAEANKDHESKKQKYEVKKGELPPKPIDGGITDDHASDIIKTMITKKVRLEGQLKAIDKEAENAQKISNQIERISDNLLNIESDEKNLDTELEKELAKVRNDFARKAANLEGAKTELKKEKLRLTGVLPMNLSSGSEEAKMISECNNEISIMKEVIQKNKLWEAVDGQYKLVEQIGQEVETAKAFADALTQRVNLLAGPSKKKLLAGVEMPIKGLEYVEGEFLLDGMKVDNLSSSKAIKLAIAIARKHAKKTKVIAIDGAEALDEETFKDLYNEIKGDGFTYFISRIGEAFDAPGSSVFKMEKGTVIQ